MAISKKQQELETLIEPAVEALGFELWGLQYVPAPKRSTLRVFIDREEGVSVDHCAAVSRQISAVLDVEDPIAGDYVLEVSSPGIDRQLFRLHQYQGYLGAKIKLRLNIPYEGRRNFTGQLVAVENEDEVILQVDNDEYVLPFESIERAQVVT